ncbi:MAG: hypothetical protein JWR21_3286 [Herminiimonas sp.]|nr:hypothetical protein [Herminiimonas sp.]
MLSIGRDTFLILALAPALSTEWSDARPERSTARRLRQVRPIQQSPAIRMRIAASRIFISHHRKSGATCGQRSGSLKQ